MTHRLVRVARSVFALALMAFAAAASGAATAQFFDPFSQFFAPQAPAFAHPPAYAPPAFYRRGPRYGRRPRAVRVWVPDRPRLHRVRRPERVRHASLPLAAQEKVRDAGTPKLVPHKPTEDPVAALLNDPTLRRGDVVVLPDGPKVFKGGATTPHRLSDFEDVHRTKMVGEKTRRQLTAMPAPSRPPRRYPEGAERPTDKPGGDQGQPRAEPVTITGSLPRRVGP